VLEVALAALEKADQEGVCFVRVDLQPGVRSANSSTTWTPAGGESERRQKFTPGGAVGVGWRHRSK
jgi:hypothetical protein